LGARRTRAEIVRRGISQATAAAEIGCSPAALSDWLKDKKSPDLESRQRIEKAGYAKVPDWDVGRARRNGRGRIAPKGKPRRARR